MNLSRNKKIILIVFLILIISSAASLVYLSIHYSSDDIVNVYLTSSDTVTVSHIDNGYYFKGKGGSDKAIIFYPGAKVEYTAYAPLMYHLAENNIDCFLMEMPFNMAIFGVDEADAIIDSYNYTDYYMAGHSLGASMAASYANSHAQKLRGIILLASYSTDPVNDSLGLLSIYGSNDGVLNIESYNSNEANWPNNSSEFVIEGANHAGYAYYGNQDGDNPASISKEAQQNITIEKILEFVN